MNEFSAGGVIIKDKKLLIVKVKNLSGKIVWTFPKGHIEKSETIENTALREVSEETGYICEIIKPLGKTQYSFIHQNKFISKKVAWFLMSPIKKIGIHDHEILTTRWVKINEAKKYLKYPTDIKLLEKIIVPKGTPFGHSGDCLGGTLSA